MSAPLLEICAYNIQSCQIAQQAGASRIELCSSPAEGGVTPSYATIQYAVEKIAIPTYVMIRTRGGGFVYDSSELSIMRKDIEICKKIGASGIAIGILKNDGSIDVEEMKRMTELAYPLGVTCHKAFDRTPDAFKALEDVIKSGCERILTSGLYPNALAGARVIADLIKESEGRIIIMPGGGVRSSNILKLARNTGAMELHSSALLPENTDYIADKKEVTDLVSELLKVPGLN